MACSDLIILLPGITGSELRKDDKIIWGYSPKIAIQAILKPSKFNENMNLKQDSINSDLEDGIVATRLLPDFHYLPGIKKVDGYSKISKYLASVEGIIPGESFFTFPYDWRRDNRFTAKLLQKFAEKKLQDWRIKSGNKDAKIILIAHSMGGLVSQYYVEVLQGWKNTRHLITFGTPFHGAIKSLGALINGPKIKGRRVESLHNLIKGFTSIYQLLPTYDAAVSHESSPAVKIGAGLDFLNLNSKKYECAEKFFEEIASSHLINLEDEEYRDTFNLRPIAGYGNKTMLSADIVGEKAILSDLFNGEMLGGDGTVPRFSAEANEVVLRKDPVYSIVKHGSLQNIKGLLDHVGGVITHKPVNLMGGTLAREWVRILEQDLYSTAEKVSIHLEGSERASGLSAKLISKNSTSEYDIVKGIQNGSYVVNLGKLPEDSYSLIIENNRGLYSETSFCVANIEEFLS